MLTFLFLAANDGFVCESYEDEAVGVLAEDGGGQSVTEVVLRPDIRWAEGHAPTATQLDALHARAHHECFISRSVRCAIRVEPREA